MRAFRHLALFGAALGLAACGKSSGATSSTNTNAPDGGGASVASADDGGGGDEPDLGSGTDDLEPDPDSADDWDPEADSGDAWGAAEEGPAKLKEDPRAELTEPTEMASVTIEIKGDGGKVRKNSPKYIRWEQQTLIPVDFEGQIHEFVVEVSNASGKLDVKLDYTVGGEEVLRGYGYGTKAKSREVLRIDNGTAVAITVTPKTLKPYTKKEREKLEGKAEKDPLAGAKE